jgi:hypothetical protein
MLVEALPIDIPLDDVSKKSNNGHDDDYNKGSFKR